MRRYFGIYLGLVVLIGVFLAGFYLGTERRPSSAETGSATGTAVIVNRSAKPAVKEIDFERFWDLWETIRERYVRQPIDEKKLFYGAMAGMVAALGDPHSIFLEPQIAEEFTQELSGKFEGIGAEIGVKKNYPVIVAPLPGSPAEKAGIMAGDRILAIDGVDTVGMGVDDAVQRIRGDKGTAVRLTITREGLSKPKDIEIVRGTIEVPSVRVESVKSPAGKKLVWLKVTNFNGDTADKFFDAVGKIVAQGYDGVILDLRNNPGGYLDAAIRMLGEWIPGEVAVSERFSDQTVEDSRSAGLGRLKDTPVIVLVNGGSASASEIMAGALQDHGKAVLIGTQTFGKGSVQDLINLREGDAVKITIAEWLTPKGQNINENGIAPDHVVELTEEDYENSRDPQLDAAKAFFDGVAPPPAAKPAQ